MPSGDALEAVLSILGLSDISEVPEDELNHYQNLFTHPLNINGASQRALRSSRLFSEYQIETLLDYRSRNSSILSERELSLIDGFGPSFTALIMPFITLDSRPESRQREVGATGAATASFKLSAGEFTPSFLAKAGAEYSDGNFATGLNLACRHADIPVGSLSFSASKCLQTLVVGNFNARFAQGLSVWSGLSIDSYTSPSALMKHPGGISPYKGSSSAYSMLGIAASFDAGQFSISPFAALREGIYGVNALWRHKNGKLSSTVHVDSGLNYFKLSGHRPVYAASVDFQQMLSPCVIYGEAAFSSLPFYDILAGVRFPAGSFDTALNVSASSEKYNASAAFSFSAPGQPHSVNLGISADYHHHAHGHSPRGAYSLKSSAIYKAVALEDFLTFDTRVSVKSRGLGPKSDPDAPYARVWPLARADLREEMKLGRQWLWASVRMDAVMLSGRVGGLAAAALAWNGKAVRLRLRACAFILDEWDMRVYVYQDDTPGAFSIPAMYGRGYSLSAFLDCRILKWMHLYMKTAYCSYPWSNTPRKDSLEGRVCLAIDWYKSL